MGSKFWGCHMSFTVHTIRTKLSGAASVFFGSYNDNQSQIVGLPMFWSAPTTTIRAKFLGCQCFGRLLQRQLEPNFGAANVFVGSTTTIRAIFVSQIILILSVM